MDFSNEKNCIKYIDEMFLFHLSLKEKNMAKKKVVKKVVKKAAPKQKKALELIVQELVDIRAAFVDRGVWYPDAHNMGALNKAVEEAN